MQIGSGAYWNRGSREKNQDSILFLQVMSRKGRVALAAVSDGMGGLAEGENASGLLVERLTECFYGELVRLVIRGRGRRAISRCLKRCLYGIRTEFERYAEGRGIQMGATISLLFLWKKKYLTVHLGDSRIYLWGGGKIRRLTVDHSNGREGLTRCLGSFPFQNPDVQGGRIWGKQGFLLCTDGFYRKLGGELAQVLDPMEMENESQIERRLEELGRAVLARGERDNLSALYVLGWGGCLW